MKTAIAITIGILIAGCTTLENKLETYEEVASRFAYPDKVRICYSREGTNNQVIQGFEARCFGDSCELPECPNAGETQ